ncbi:peptide MFS transporter [bacterium]|nr:peptide MFS transporter [bacterium]
MSDQSSSEEGGGLAIGRPGGSQEGSGHPRGLYLLFATEMWERFSFYGMRAIFVLFMSKALLMSKAEASNIYGSYGGLVYLTPLLGGYMSDRFLGNRRSILAGGLMMALGQFLMFLSGSNIVDGVQSKTAVSLMWAGLTFLIIGNGFFKPNISTMVGQLYPPGDRRVDAAFTIFYMGINLGAFFSPLVCGGIGDTGDIHDFRYGFLTACIGMLIGIVTFEWKKNKLLVSPDGQPVGMPRSPLDLRSLSVLVGSVAMIFFLLNFKTLFHTEHDAIAYLIYASIFVMPMIILSDKGLSHEERSRISVIFILALFVIFFWACFEQAGASLTLFADAQTDRRIGSWVMPASFFQSVNPLAIIFLAPLFSMMWGALGKRGLEPSSPMKMAFGLLLLALGYMVIAFAVHGVDSNTKINMWWLIMLYILHTMGELSLSPIGLSMVSKLSPARFSSLLMGTWFLANAVANKFAGTLSALIPPGAGEAAAGPAVKIPTFLGFEVSNLFSFFCVFIGLSGTASILLFVMYRWLEKKMHGVK